MEKYPHISVLCREWLAGLVDNQLQIYVDGTLGAGGHAEAVLQAHPEIKKMIGIDQDPSALEIAEKRLAPWKDKLILVQGNFGELEDILIQNKIEKIDAMLMDLGVSSMQFDQAERGFSFMNDGPLDMRMNPEQTLSAMEIVNEWSVQEIGRVLREYGEEQQWRQLAKAIVKAREEAPIKTTEQLKNLLRPLFPFWRQKKGIHPLTLTFQALRIAVNRELEVLESVLPIAIDKLSSGGRLGTISFHSLEDRLVKNAFRWAASDKVTTSGIGGVFQDKDPIIKILTGRPLIAADDEVGANPRSRSAKLRIAEKL